jgi:trans-aconitate methyltransferase
MDLVEVQKRQGAQIARHPWELARLEVVNNILKDVLKNKKDFTVLDIGCGDIFFISSLSERYPEATFYAIDIAFTDEMIAKLKEESKGKRIHLFKTLDEAGAHLSKPADLVLLLDVVEHIEHDKKFLGSLHENKSIDKNTRIMITVPAYQSLFCSHDHFLGHYRRYTNKTLLSTIEECGFEKIRLGYFFFSLVPPRILQVIREKISKPSLEHETTGLVEWNKGAGITGMIKSILYFDYKFTNALSRIGIKFPGLSNYILCKKPA